MTTVTMIYPDIPDDQALLAAIGTMVIRHGHLEYILRMTIKTLLQLDIQTALRQTEKQSASKMRKTILEESKEKLSFLDHQTLSNYIERAWKLSEQRNIIAHSMWAKELDGPLLLRDNDKWRPCPSTENVLKLVEEIRSLTDSFNQWRLEEMAPAPKTSTS